MVVNGNPAIAMIRGGTESTEYGVRLSKFAVDLGPPLR